MIRTSHSVRENADLLESYLANQKRPSGFVIQDPRLEGQVNGSTFSLRAHGAWMWGSLVPKIEGEIIPNEAGSDVLVEVAHSYLSLTLFALLIAAVVVAVILNGLTLQSAGFLAYMMVVSGAAILFPVVLHGSHAAKALGEILLSAPA